MNTALSTTSENTAIATPPATAPTARTERRIRGTALTDFSAAPTLAVAIVGGHTKTLASCRRAIAANLEAVLKAVGDMETMSADEQKLNEHIDKLTSDADYRSPEDAGNLHTAQTRLSLLRNRIESITNRAEPQMQALRESIADLKQPIRDALKPAAALLQREIAIELMPSTGIWLNAWRAATGTAKYHSFACFYFMRMWGGRADSIAEARETLKILDALLDGKNLWTFAVEAIPAAA